MCTAFTVIIWSSHSTGIGIEQTRVEKGYLFFSKRAAFFQETGFSIPRIFMCMWRFSQFKITIIIIMSLNGLPG